MYLGSTLARLGEVGCAYVTGIDGTWNKILGDRGLSGWHSLSLCASHLAAVTRIAYSRRFLAVVISTTRLRTTKNIILY
jgi:hypothetical protein